jgi:hypothetical protein
MIWIDHREMKRLPINGQEVWYFGPPIGVWRGHFKIDWADGFSPYLFICGEESFGCVDHMDVTHWMPYEAGSSRPPRPKQERLDE